MRKKARGVVCVVAGAYFDERLRDCDRTVLGIMQNLIFKQGGSGELSRRDLEISTGRSWSALRPIRRRLREAGYLSFEESSDLAGASAATVYQLHEPAEATATAGAVYQTVDAERESRGQPTLYDRRAVREHDPDGSLLDLIASLLVKARQRLNPVKVARRLLRGAKNDLGAVLERLREISHNVNLDPRHLFALSSVGAASRSYCEEVGGRPSTGRRFSCPEGGGHSVTPSPGSPRDPLPPATPYRSTRARSTTEVPTASKKQEQADVHSANESRARAAGVLEAWSRHRRSDPAGAEEALRVVEEATSVDNPGGLFWAAFTRGYVSRRTIREREAAYSARKAALRAAREPEAVRAVEPKRGAFGAAAVSFAALFGGAPA